MHPLPTFVASPFLVFAIRWVAPSSCCHSLGGPFLPPFLPLPLPVGWPLPPSSSLPLVKNEDCEVSGVGHGSAIQVSARIN